MAAGALAADPRLSLTALTDITPRPQVVYLDPMFPHKQKSALVKKEMRVFQSLVGPDCRCRWPAGAGSPARDEAGGGEAPGLRAAAGGRCHDQCGDHKGTGLIFIRRCRKQSLWLSGVNHRVAASHIISYHDDA